LNGENPQDFVQLGYGPRAFCHSLIKRSVHFFRSLGVCLIGSLSDRLCGSIQTPNHTGLMLGKWAGLVDSCRIKTSLVAPCCRLLVSPSHPLHPRPRPHTTSTITHHVHDHIPRPRSHTTSTTTPRSRPHRTHMSYQPNPAYVVPKSWGIEHLPTPPRTEHEGLLHEKIVRRVEEARVNGKSEEAINNYKKCGLRTKTKLMRETLTPSLVTSFDTSSFGVLAHTSAGSAAPRRVL
jgi:hypothetical protein